MRLDETVIAFDNPADQLEHGLEYCRKGDWKTGLAHLTAVAERQKEPGHLPSRYYSYLGYAMAIQEKRITEGIKLCRYAVKQEFFQVENYVNLARIYLLAKRRGPAFKAIAQGLKIDANNPELVKLHRTLGERRPPVLSFLSRSNPFNQILGRLRHAFSGGAKKSSPPPAAKSKTGRGNKPPGARRASRAG